MLQANGHTVGFLGDGINDAAALREADVGVSVDTAADIAKESADIILLEKSLLVLEQGVITGRETFGNIINFYPPCRAILCRQRGPALLNDSHEIPGRGI
jgi:Mg2+-importing ATPase